MTPQEEKFMKEWPAFQLFGRKRWIIITLLFAITTLLVSEKLVRLYNHLMSGNVDWIRITGKIIAYSVVCLLAYFLAVWMWKSSEKRYEKLKNEQ